MIAFDWENMTQGNNCANINGGFRGIDDYGSGIRRFRALRAISRMVI